VGTTTLEDDLHRAWAKLRGKPDPTLKIGREENNDGDDYIWALRDISFEVKQGEILGIIAATGPVRAPSSNPLPSYRPHHRRMPCQGPHRQPPRSGHRLPSRTHRPAEHLPQRCHPRYDKEEIKQKFDGIVAFAEMKKFIDTPVKRYSSGMYVRLAFAVAAHLEPEILVVDEVAGGGDAAFQMKCLGK